MSGAIFSPLLLVDFRAFLHALRDYGLPVILTYHPVELTTGLNRDFLGWANALSMEELCPLMEETGFNLVYRKQVTQYQFIFYLTPK